MNLSDPYPIVPFTVPVNATVRVPGSKSITNRALLLAALSGGETTLSGALFSEDTTIMITALRQLGFTINENPAHAEIRVQGRQGDIPAKSANLFVGLAGTAARFLTALCCLAPHGTYQLDGVPQMRNRPMKSLLDALEALGAEIESDNGCFPLTIHAHGLNGGDVELDATESSQLLSALLMVAPLADGPVRIKLTDSGYRHEYVTMTLRLMEQFGQAPAEISEDNLVVKPPSGRSYSPPNTRFAIEPDASAASYFMALPYVTGGTVRMPGIKREARPLQADILFAQRLDFLGVSLYDEEDGLRLDFDRSVPRTTEAGDVFEGSFHAISDTFLTLAAIAPLHNGRVSIYDIAHTRKQETDRIACMARELTRLGQGVNTIDAKTDFLEITPNLAELKRRAARGLIEIETYGDHRFAMSFAILGSHNLLGDETGRPCPWLAIKNPGVCAKTFPGFFDVLERARKDSLAAQ